MRRGARGLAEAVRFLTILPVPGGAVPVATHFFPLVGLGLGLGLAGLRAALPAEGLLPAALVVAAWTGATGGLHEDAWADCADAVLAPVERGRRLQILRDPHVGAHGLVAVLVLLLLRFAAVTDAPWWALIGPPVVGRWAMVLSLALARPLRRSGLGASLAASARPWGASGVAAGALASVAMVAGAERLPTLLIGVSVGLACALGIGVFLHARLGGLSGDGHGAVGMAAETGALCAVALAGSGGV